MGNISATLSNTFATLSDIFRKTLQIDDKLGSFVGTSIKQSMDGIKNAVDGNGDAISDVQSTLDDTSNGLAAIKNSVDGINLDLSPVTDKLDSGVYGLSKIKNATDDVNKSVGVSITDDGDNDTLQKKSRELLARVGDYTDASCSTIHSKLDALGDSVKSIDSNVETIANTLLPSRFVDDPDHSDCYYMVIGIGQSVLENDLITQ